MIIGFFARSNAQGALGFVDDDRRLNVVVTRARRGLILIGAASTLVYAAHRAVKRLVEYHFKEKSLVTRDW